MSALFGSSKVPAQPMPPEGRTAKGVGEPGFAIKRKKTLLTNLQDEFAPTTRRPVLGSGGTL